MRNIFVGVDPGRNGGFAAIVGHEILVMAWDDKEFVKAMAASVGNDYNYVTAFVEKVSAMPKQGVTSMFNFGKSAGFIEGVLAGLAIPYQLITPKTWKKEFGLGSDKAESIKVCERLFPNISLFRTDKCKKKHDGMAEALLIAEYCRRRTQGS